MNFSNFLVNFINQFDETEHSIFSSETKFKELDEWSSLVALSIIAMVDEKYSIKLTGEDIKLSNTIKDLFQVIAGKV
jgi:acyl carrier protein